jgi:hypothetical protein
MLGKKKSNVLQQVDEVSKWIAMIVITVAVITFLVAKFSGNLSYLLNFCSGLCSCYDS